MQYDSDDPRLRSVLDHGFVFLVDHMGDDAALCQAARVSYGAGTKSVRDDRNLIRYLFRHSHSSPIEQADVKFHLRVPIFVMRQLIRHRTACLAGDVRLTFDLPAGKTVGGPRAHPLSVEEVYNRFQPAVALEANFGVYSRRDRVKAMQLRCCDEDTLQLCYTKITDIWQNGVKPVVRVDFPDGSYLRATTDHRCFTDRGWLSLGEPLDSHAKFASFCLSTGYVSEHVEFTEAEILAEEWRQIADYPIYEVSSLGRIRSWSNFRWGVRDTPVIKEQTVSAAGYGVVSLSSGGISRAFLVHRLIREAFRPDIADGMQTRHRDNNRRNNRLTNLDFGSALDNANDRITTGCDQRLCIAFVAPLSWQADGETMTYDLSVEGPFRNFSAGNIVVHNSVNEYSGRYSVMTDQFYVPAATSIQPQSQDNRQGRAGTLSEVSVNGTQWLMETVGEHAYEVYRVLLGERPERPAYDPYDSAEPLLDADFPGIARELARTVLPVSYYTECYWKQNLWNLFHLLKLRTDPHAQYETRVVAEAMYDLIKPLFPSACEAYEDFIRDAVTLSRMEVALVRDLLRGQTVTIDAARYGMSKREVQEFTARFLEHSPAGQ